MLIVGVKRSKQGQKGWEVVKSSLQGFGLGNTRGGFFRLLEVGLQAALGSACHSLGYESWRSRWRLEVGIHTILLETVNPRKACWLLSLWASKFCASGSHFFRAVVTAAYTSNREARCEHAVWSMQSQCQELHFVTTTLRGQPGGHTF